MGILQLCSFILNAWIMGCFLGITFMIKNIYNWITHVILYFSHKKYLQKREILDIVTLHTFLSG